MNGQNYERLFRILWPAGLAIFAIVIWIGWPLSIDAVPGGILDHQAAGEAARVDAIQEAWSYAGLYDRAVLAMFCDIAFITVYGLGSWYGGLAFMQDERRKVRRLGALLIGAAIVFIATDYAETFAQLVQLWSMRGSDNLASLAAALRPVKIAAWLVTIICVLAASALRRFSSPS